MPLPSSWTQCRRSTPSMRHTHAERCVDAHECVLRLAWSLSFCDGIIWQGGPGHSRQWCRSPIVAEKNNTSGTSNRIQSMCVWRYDNRFLANATATARATGITGQKRRNHSDPFVTLRVVSPSLVQFRLHSFAYWLTGMRIGKWGSGDGGGWCAEWTMEWGRGEGGGVSQ